MFNPFIGWGKTRLEEALADAQDDLARGKMTISAGAGDASASSMVQMGAMQRIGLLLKALNRVDPVTYPLSETALQTRTTVSVTSLP